MTGSWRIGHHERATERASKGLVLVVEDERPIADLVRHVPDREGFGVHVEHDGESGLAAARKIRPVACVLDIGLRGLDGTEICRRLRESGDWTPVIFLTARDDEVDRILGLELGADDYLTKPFSPRELVARRQGGAAAHGGHARGLAGAAGRLGRHRPQPSVGARRRRIRSDDTD